MKWVKIVSWHAIATPTRMFDTYKTLCGRRATSTDIRDELPSEKTCESCLRIYTRKADA